PPGSTIRAATSAPGLHGEDLRRHAVVPRRRPLHGDPRRHRARHRPADREILARPAQHDDHRGSDRDPQDDARAACAAHLWITKGETAMAEYKYEHVKVHIHN